MATLPRLPPAAEHRLLRAVCGLPPRVLRRLFGPPMEVDGQTLAPDIQALLGMARLAGSESFTEGIPIATARRNRLQEAEVVAERPPLPMARVEAVEIPGPGGTIAARRFVPRGAQTGSAPLLVYYHGGGWAIGDLDTHDAPCRFLAAHSGVQVLSIDYRLAPEHRFPAAAEDALAAYRWADDNAEALGADPNRIAVGGDSAGANLAAVASLLARDTGLRLPAMQLLIYPVTVADEELPSRSTFGEGFLLSRPDMDFFERHYLPEGTDRSDTRISILRADDLGGLPPAYLAIAGFDPLRDEGVAFAERLEQAGVPVSLRLHSGLVHTFANLTAVCPSAREAMLEAVGALRMGLAA
ncbi:MAG TPA: alpha/beta hydrolase [Solirubrobacterales bacterium]|nr:alpha/beta hydrolase [Solirubrobacterales bacterium]